MTTTIIVPRGHERMIDLHLPPALAAILQDAPAHRTLALSFIAEDGEHPAATHTYPPNGADALVAPLRKRLPPPPPTLRALRFALEGADPVDVAAHAPDLSAFAAGTIAIDPPEQWPPDTLVALTVTLTNKGSLAWDHDVALRLDLDGKVQHVPLPAAVPPGQEVSFDIPIRTPATLGPWAVGAALTLGPALPFARGRSFKPARQIVTIAAADPRAATLPSCHIAIADLPPALLAGEAFVLHLTVTNTGPIRLEPANPGALRLRARWRREPREGGPVRDPVIALLPHAIEPGASATMALDVTAPSVAGTYLVDVLAIILDERTRLDRDHWTCPAIRVEVVDGADTDNATERTIRGDQSAAAQAALAAAYADWASRCDTFADANDAARACGLDHWPVHPRIGIALTGNPTAAERDHAARWLAGQRYPYWHLLPAPSATTDLIVAWNVAHGHLADHALMFLAGTFARNPDLAWAYADVDHWDAEGGRADRVFLPAPDRFFAHAQPITGLVGAVRPHALRAAGVAIDDPGFAAALAAHLPLSAIAHIPEVLFHRHAHTPPHADPAPPSRQDDWRLAKMHDAPGFIVRAPLPVTPPSVALIIPTRDRLDLLAPFIGSILERTAYPAFEIIIVDNGSQQAETLAYLSWLREQGHARVLRDDAPFNWSRVNNLAAATTNADILCFLNNDMEVIDGAWLTELVALTARPEVGVAGATLWFPDGSVQHGGVVFSARGGPLHPFRAAARGASPFYLRSLRTQAAVTGACLAVRRSVFDAVGGFDEAFPLGFNDVDFCMRVAEEVGLPSVCSPSVELLHKESASRGHLRSEADRARARREFAWFEGRHLEAALADRWAATIAHETRRTAPLTMIARQPQGARLAARRYARAGMPPIALIDLPGTATPLARTILERALPDRAVTTLGARAVLEGQAGDPATAARLAPLLREGEVASGPFAYGFGAAIGWPCRYAAILRNPVDRMLAHHAALTEAPDAPLAPAPLADLLRKGVIRGNLMLSRILGEAPEPVRFADVHGRFPHYVGYGLPEAVWRGTAADLPDIAPDEDEAKVAAALAIIGRDFAFVGLHDRLEDHLTRFGASIDLATIGYVPAPENPSRDYPPTDEDLAAIQTYNRLDRLLYEAIAALPDGLFLNPPRPPEATI